MFGSTYIFLDLFLPNGDVTDLGNNIIQIGCFETIFFEVNCVFEGRKPSLEDKNLSILSPKILFLPHSIAAIPPTFPSAYLLDQLVA